MKTRQFYFIGDRISNDNGSSINAFIHQSNSIQSQLTTLATTNSNLHAIHQPASSHNSHSQPTTTSTISNEHNHDVASDVDKNTLDSNNNSSLVNSKSTGEEFCRLYFPEFKVSTIDSDQFCDDNGIPHPRFPALINFKEAHHAHDPLQIFKTFFPTEFARRVIIPNTSKSLHNNGYAKLCENEFWTYLAIRIAVTLIRPSHVRDLWWTTDRSRFRKAFNFGQFMSRDRFELITQHLIFHSQVDLRDPLFEVRELIDAFNKNNRDVFTPSWLVCVDESMTKWTNRNTLPCWVFVPRKPTEAGIEWHDIACASSNIVFVVEPVEQRPDHFVRKFESQGKMASVVLNLCDQAGLFEQQHRVLVGDSAFAGILLMKELRSRHIFSIFAFKKHGNYWNKGLPGDKLLSATLTLPLGQSITVLSNRSVQPKFFLVGARDMNPCLLMANCGSSLPSGEIQSRWIMNNNIKSRVQFTRSDTLDIYYQARHGVDDSNNLRQGHASIEEAWRTHSWQLRCFAFFVALSETNSFNAWKLISSSTDMDHDDFRHEIISSLLLSPTELDSTDEEEILANVHQKMKYPKDRYYDSTLKRWRRRATKLGDSTIPLKRCSAQGATSYHKTQYYCSCDPTKPLCVDHFIEHIATKNK